jgi:prevent-host-death family protein
MDSVNTTEARENLAEVINRVTYAKDRVRITRRGKQVAAMVPIEARNRPSGRCSRQELQEG